jgi:site-specific recombinase XerD
MVAAQVEGFLIHLAVAKGVSASTQNQAKRAVLFLYKEVLGEPLPWLEGIESAKRPARLPAVLTREEVESILTHLSGTVGLMIRLLYGTGMRIMECVRQRVKGYRIRGVTGARWNIVANIPPCLAAGASVVTGCRCRSCSAGTIMV